jgi:hypothetical protein
MDYEKKYKEALERARIWKEKSGMPKNKQGILDDIFPELSETEHERIRKRIIALVNAHCQGMYKDEMLTWLEKQGNTNETINKNRFAQGVLRGAAINLITWIDYNATEGNMCLSNMECKDIEDALVSGDWDKIYAYIKKKLEKQGEKPTDNDKIEALRTEYEKGRADAIAEMQKEWSEEDELSLKQAIYVCHQNGYTAVENWLKSLKQRIGG